MNEMITAKEVRMKLRNGMGTDYFLERLDIPTPEELMNYMEKYHTSLAKDFKKGIKANDKVLARKKSSAKSAEVTVCVLADEMEDNEEDTKEDSSEKADEPNEDSKEAEKLLEDVIGEAEASKEDLDNLRKEEEQASKCLMKLESEHKEFVLRRHSKVEELRKYKEELQKLYTQMDKKKHRIRELLVGYETLGDKMHQAADKVASQKEKLDAIRKEISSLMEVRIYVYRNGQFELENADSETVELDKAKEQDMFSKLLSMPESDELTLKELKTIPVLVETVAHFANLHKVTVAFEDSQMETLYNSLVAS